MILTSFLTCGTPSCVTKVKREVKSYANNVPIMCVLCVMLCVRVCDKHATEVDLLQELYALQRIILVVDKHLLCVCVCVCVLDMQCYS